jgi:hypothetical protein
MVRSFLGPVTGSLQYRPILVLNLPRSPETAERSIHYSGPYVGCPMPQILLQGTRIDPLIRQIKSARMPQHVGVDGKRQPRRNPSLGQIQVGSTDVRELDQSDPRRLGRRLRGHPPGVQAKQPCGPHERQLTQEAPPAEPSRVGSATQVML